jgi:dienelactone hydrolase
VTAFTWAEAAAALMERRLSPLVTRIRAELDVIRPEALDATAKIAAALSPLDALEFSDARHAWLCVRADVQRLERYIDHSNDQRAWARMQKKEIQR